ncbi:MAG TPA: hypothetical protein VIP07_04570 [Candidatus Limnocylindria bacterium]|jgi:hypothetical protein
MEPVERLDVTQSVPNGDLDTRALRMPRVSSVGGGYAAQGCPRLAIERQDVAYRDGSGVGGARTMIRAYLYARDPVLDGEPFELSYER